MEREEGANHDQDGKQALLLEKGQKYLTKSDSPTIMPHFTCIGRKSQTL